MKYLDIKGKMVQTCGGATLGLVADIILDVENSLVHGVIVSVSGILNSFHYIPLKNLKIGQNGIIAKAITSPVKRSFLRRNKQHEMRNYMGMEIRNSDNQSVGKLVDLVFDFDSGELQAVVASKGFFEDVFEGRRIIINDGSIKLSETCINLCDNCSLSSEAFYSKYMKE